MTDKINTASMLPFNSCLVLTSVGYLVLMHRKEALTLP